MTASPTILEKLAAIVEPASLALRAPRSQSFVSDVAASFRGHLDRYGWLSDRQLALLDKLYSEAALPPFPAVSKPAPTSAPIPAAPPTLRLGEGIHKVRELFEMALRRGLKRPGIRVSVDGEALHLKMAPDHSKNRGCIYVIAGETYAGKISPQGTYAPSPGGPLGVVAALDKFGRDPAGVAATYGRQTGSCCFCSRPLEDPRSVSVGYGPICAGNYGLPWGDETPTPRRRAPLVAEAVGRTRCVGHCVIRQEASNWCVYETDADGEEHFTVACASEAHAVSQAEQMTADLYQS